MLLDATYLSAFLVALLGGVHCAGMCGGIVGALTLSLPEETRRRFASLLPYLLAYNGGRILSYVAAGTLMGGFGAVASRLAAVHQAQLALQLLAGLFMVALGLYVAGWWRGLLVLERAGARLVWSRLEPVGRTLLPVRSPTAAFRLGVVWGWLPCGLVYTVLIWCISTGGALEGALLMLSFGLGTLPALLAMGAFAGLLARFVQRPGVKASAGFLIVVFGLYQIALVVGRP